MKIHPNAIKNLNKRRQEDIELDKYIQYVDKNICPKCGEVAVENHMTYDTCLDCGFSINRIRRKIEYAPVKKINGELFKSYDDGLTWKNMEKKKPWWKFW